jgi:hypothetical protein
MNDIDTSYEALLALGDTIGEAKPKGLPDSIINSLPVVVFSRALVMDDVKQYYIYQWILTIYTQTYIYAKIHKHKYIHTDALYA